MTAGCCREEEGRKRVRLLQRQLQDVRKEKETELQQRNEMIAHYKDQLQEMKAKTNMEGTAPWRCHSMQPKLLQLQIYTPLFSSSTCSIQRCKATSAKSWFAAAGKYIKKVAEVSVAQTQKRCNKTEEQLKDEIDVSACDLVDTGVRAESFAML